MNKTIYKNISVSKLKDTPETNSKLPTHSLNISDNNFENKRTAGKLWTKEGQYGKFLSGKMVDEFKGEKTTFEGYSIISDEYLKFLLDNQTEVEDIIQQEEYPF